MISPGRKEEEKALNPAQIFELEGSFGKQNSGEIICIWR